MSLDHPEEASAQAASHALPASSALPSSDASNDSKTYVDHGSTGNAKPAQATVVVRGETVRSDEARSPPKDKPKSPPKPVSEAKVAQQHRLPSLDDDRDVGVPKEQVVIRDGKADLAFTGTLLASAAPSSAPEGKWKEYRVYETSGGKHVFSKISRSVYAAEQDSCEADTFDPSPSSTTSALLRSARDLTRSHPLTWTDAAVDFFGYDPLAKALYRKLGSQFEERIA